MAAIKRNYAIKAVEAEVVDCPRDDKAKKREEMRILRPEALCSWFLGPFSPSQFRGLSCHFLHDWQFVHLEEYGKKELLYGL